MYTQTTDWNQLFKVAFKSTQIGVIQTLAVSSAKANLKTSLITDMICHVVYSWRGQNRGQNQWTTCIYILNLDVYMYMNDFGIASLGVEWMIFHYFHYCYHSFIVFL